MGKKKTNLKPAPSLPPFPGLTWLQTPLTPSKQCRGLWGTGVCTQYTVFSLWCSFHLTLFLCSSVQSSWAMVSSGTSTTSGTGTPQAAADTYSTMEHLLVSPLLFRSLRLLLQHFVPFVFTEMAPGWLAQLCPEEGSLEEAMSSRSNPWHLLRGHYCSSHTPKPSPPTLCTAC